MLIQCSPPFDHTQIFIWVSSLSVSHVVEVEIDSALVYRGNQCLAQVQSINPTPLAWNGD